MDDEKFWRNWGDLKYALIKEGKMEDDSNQEQRDMDLDNAIKRQQDKPVEFRSKGQRKIIASGKKNKS